MSGAGPEDRSAALSARLGSARGDLSRLRAELAAAEAEQAAALQRADFTAADAAAARVAALGPQLVDAERAVAALQQAEQVVAAERVRADHERRLAEVERQVAGVESDLAVRVAEVDALLEAVLSGIRFCQQLEQVGSAARQDRMALRASLGLEELARVPSWRPFSARLDSDPLLAAVVRAGAGR